MFKWFGLLALTIGAHGITMDAKGNTPLMVFAQRGDIDSLKCILPRLTRDQIMAKNKIGKNALMLAAEWYATSVTISDQHVLMEAHEACNMLSHIQAAAQLSPQEVAATAPLKKHGDDEYSAFGIWLQNGRLTFDHMCQEVPMGIMDFFLKHTTDVDLIQSFRRFDVWHAFSISNSIHELTPTKAINWSSTKRRAAFGKVACFLAWGVIDIVPDVKLPWAYQIIAQKSALEEVLARAEASVGPDHCRWNSVFCNWHRDRYKSLDQLITNDFKIGKKFLMASKVPFGLAQLPNDIVARVFLRLFPVYHYILDMKKNGYPEFQASYHMRLPSNHNNNKNIESLQKHTLLAHDDFLLRLSEFFGPAYVQMLNRLRGIHK